MAYRFSNLVQSYIEFALGPMALYTFGPYTLALVVNLSASGLSTNRAIFEFMDSSNATNKLQFRIQSANLLQVLQGGSSVGPTATLGSVWYTIAVTRAAGSSSNRYHIFDGTSWTHSASSTNTIADVSMISGDRFRFGIAPGNSGNLVGDAVCAGIKKTDSTDLQIETLGGTGFPSWQSYGFDWLVRFDDIATRTNVANPGSGDETSRGTALTLVADPPPPWTWTATTYAWDFGDSGTSTATNPVHVYANPGVYTVSLTATNAAGSNTKTRTNYITALSSPACPLLDNFNRADENPLNPTNWQARQDGNSFTVNPMRVLSNQAACGTSGQSYAVWLPLGSMSNCSACATMVNAADRMEVIGRMKPGVATDFAAYLCAEYNPGLGGIVLRTFDGSNTLPSNTSPTPYAWTAQAGDKLGITMNGLDAAAYVWRGGTWNLAQTGTLGAGTFAGWGGVTSGLIGMSIRTTGSAFDDFGGAATVTGPTYLPQILLFPPTAVTPVGTTWEQARSYADLANRPAVTGTTRPFASLAALTGALNAAAPGDLVSYTGAGILDIPGNYTGLAGRRYTGYVNVDLGLAASANHVRFPGGGGAGLPAVGIYGSSYLRIYGGEITNPPPKTVGHDGLHIYGAGHPGDGATHHITWWNLVVHDTVDSGIKLLPNVPFPGGTQSAADNTISDCDIEATVYMIGRDKTVDTHPEPGTGQHCALLADTDPSGATYPSFLRNRVAIDGYNTGLSSSQGGGSIAELGFNDAASTISGCTLILRGNNTLFNAQQQTAGNGLNLWGDATIRCAVPFLQHSNATGSAVCNFPPGTNRSGVTVAYGRHANTNQNAYEGTNPWQIGPTYLNIA